MTFSLREGILLALFAGILCATLYVVMQQQGRLSANDPQIQMVEDAVTALQSGWSLADTVPATRVDIENSLSPYIVMYDTAENPVAGNGFLHGSLPHLPGGVLAEAKKRGGTYTITWQPESGVRQALAIQAYRDGYVVSGRSLRETEDHIQKIGTLVLFGWAACTIFALIFALLLRPKKVT